MERIRTLIVDDEELARKRLIGLLEPYKDIEIVGEAEDGEKAIEKIEELEPELVFLDIQMPVCSGIEVAASLRSEGPNLIFCTAYDQYAIEAFEVHAVDYLLKPVSRSRLAKSLERIQKGEKTAKSVNEAVRQVTPTRFLGKRGNRFKVIPQEAVLYFWAEGGITQLWSGDEYYWMDPNLTELEERLEGAGFSRISRQALINLDGVEEVIPLIGGHGQVRMQGGVVLDVSRRRMKPLIEKLESE